MIKSLFFIPLFFISNLYSLELKCNFEEVYVDGSIQNGFFLIQNHKLRYEYSSERLFTIIHNQDQTFLIRNNDYKIVNKINENTEIIDELLNISTKYPDIEKEYKSDDLIIKIEKALKGNFVKRILINSPEIKVSIYFNDCHNIKIQNKYFSHIPFFEYNPN
ncbi:MAG: hypothetical protein CBD35_04530 [Verrucomicrobia bacterium TMED175]|nr:MAG: hypothetical protein CBD35_04530 [Verrucomicrobia bacterium TMED175]